MNKQVFARRKRYAEIILKMCPQVKETSGIYLFHRVDENGFKYAYVGQAQRNLLKRLVDHLMGYTQHIDRSIIKHKLYSADNPYGYKISIITYCTPDKCDELEKQYIKVFADKGYQLRNHTIGGQSDGKAGLGENRPSKGYRDGLLQGYKNAQRHVRKLFEKNLVYSINGEPNKNKIKALEKFEAFLQTEKESE